MRGIERRRRTIKRINSFAFYYIFLILSFLLPTRDFWHSIKIYVMCSILKVHALSHEFLFFISRTMNEIS